MEFEDDDFSYMEYSQSAQIIKPMGRSEVKVLSDVKNPLSVDVSVPNPTPMLMDLGPKIREIIKEIPDDIYYDPDELAPEVKKSFDFIVDGFSKILTYKYEPLPSRERQTQMAKAMVVPEVAFINNELGKMPGHKQVLLVGNGARKDLRRLDQSKISYTPTVVCTSEIVAKEIRKVNAKISLFRGTLPEAYEAGFLYGKKFDGVICNLSMHYCLGTHRSPEFVQIIDKVLAAGGVMYGSYIDIPTLKAVNFAKVTQYGHGALYLGEKMGAVIHGERVVRALAQVSMGGVVFNDPIIELDDVYNLFEVNSRLETNVYTGTDLITGATERGPIYYTAGKFNHVVSRPELGLLRCVIAHRPAKPLDVPCGYAPTPRIMKAKDIDSMMYAVDSVSFNKGRPCRASDLMYLDANSTWVGVKHNGVAAKGIYKQGAFRVLCEDDTYYKVEGYTGTCPHTFVVQLEVVRKDGKPFFIATDVLLAVWGQSGNFISRWRWLQRICQNYKMPFALQNWHVFEPNNSLMALMMDEKLEGIVLQSLMAQPSLIVGHRGSAVYVKRVWTKDVVENGKIVEVTMDGVYVRDRPDKKEPNPRHVLDALAHAITYNQMLAYTFSKFVGILGGSWVRLHMYLTGYYPPENWPDAELLMFYQHRNDAIMRFMTVKNNPEYLRCIVNEIIRRAPRVKKESFEINQGTYTSDPIFGDERDAFAENTADEIMHVESEYLDHKDNNQPLPLRNINFDVLPEAVRDRGLATYPKLYHDEEDFNSYLKDLDDSGSDILWYQRVDLDEVGIFSRPYTYGK